MPLLLTDGEVIILSCDPNIPAGVMSDWTYTQQQIQLKRGTTIFLYTDGLNEAENISHQQFDMERVIATAKASSSRPQELIAAMNTAVQQFVGDAEQSDDLTMFAIKLL
jgi:sigma-B regulation protein RsbU (phosphoserine phosphatase)